MKALHPLMHTIPMAIHPFSHPCINATDPSIILAYHLSTHPPVSSVYLLIHSCSQSCIHALTCSFNSHQHLLSSDHHVTHCKCTCDKEQLHGGVHILSAQTGLRFPDNITSSQDYVVIEFLLVPTFWPESWDYLWSCTHSSAVLWGKCGLLAQSRKPCIPAFHSVKYEHFSELDPRLRPLEVAGAGLDVALLAT